MEKLNPIDNQNVIEKNEASSLHHEELKDSSQEQTGTRINCFKRDDSHDAWYDRIRIVLTDGEEFVFGGEGDQYDSVCFKASSDGESSGHIILDSRGYCDYDECYAYSNGGVISIMNEMKSKIPSLYEDPGDCNEEVIRKIKKIEEGSPYHCECNDGEYTRPKDLPKLPDPLILRYKSKYVKEIELTDTFFS